MQSMQNKDDNEEEEMKQLKQNFACLYLRYDLLKI